MDTDSDDESEDPWRRSRSTLSRRKRRMRQQEQQEATDSDEDDVIILGDHGDHPAPNLGPDNVNLEHDEIPHVAESPSHLNSPNESISFENLPPFERGDSSESEWSPEEICHASVASDRCIDDEDEHYDNNGIDANDDSDFVPYEEDGDSSEEESGMFEIQPGSMNTVLSFDTPRTVKESLMLDLCMSVRHCWTYESLMATFSSKNVLFETKNFPRSKKELWRLLGRKQAGIVPHVLCACGNYIGRKKRLPHRVKCVCGEVIVTSEAKIFFTVSLKKQLKQFLETPGIPDLLQSWHKRRNEDLNVIEDYYDGQRYKELRKSMGPLDFTYVGNTDGCKASKGAKFSIYPFFLRINELTPNLRQKFIFIAGIYGDKEEPHMNAFLKPIVEQELNSLTTEGVQWYRDGNMENEMNVSRVFPHCICVDGKARYQMLNMVPHSSFYACPNCTFKGVTVNRVMRYPTKPHELIPPPEERTHARMVTDMLTAYNNPRDSPPVFGHKGLSALAGLKHFNLETGIAFDDLHNLYECASKVNFELLLNEAPRCKNAENKDLSFADIERILDARLKKILTPSKISRKPKNMQVTNRKKYKGTEWRNILLYYGVPLFQGLVVNSHIRHFELLSHAAFLLSKDSIIEEEIVKAERLIKRYLMLFDDYYGIENTRFNLHGLLHAGKSVRNLGPLFSYSTFNFESWNNKLLTKVSSPQSPLLQIITRHQIQMYLELNIRLDPELSDDIKSKCSEILKQKVNPRVNVVNIEDHVHVLGPVKANRQLTNSEEQVLVRELIDIQTIDVYEKIIVNGVVYETQRSRKINALSDNSMIYTHQDTFCTIQDVVTFRRNGRLECGLFVEEHSVQPQQFTEAQHIATLSPSNFNIMHFIFPLAIRCPVVQVVVNDIVHVSPMPNLFEID
ncbi:Dynein heavy chain, cytoplasmic [Frankliniella fusca]|uniref:Dynein heavy chain, cytoplasmic n=1 Tax=Frankliniella fusca TaxID=407009 RepID=A0AAE1HE38_9NEOP|nr:Dynein heavy chain, cytoplasmic [Frankliniella fusca]KAK3919645.1 Dynein heavy chain, cytoplasmic [Frankliniella fusca]KAK3929867.1 Dynein heavy chain, cytoplasmic [Frankliniella fusca]KAK3932306.1 Dynein heavy chain, cytoplasmic [Frankliniella fusca]